MTLGFKLYHGEQPTHFPEKILQGMHLNGAIYYQWFMHYIECLHLKFPDYQALPDFNGVKPKLHTIRDNSKGLWRVGMGIHFVVGNRTKQRYQFAPVVPVTSLQEVYIYRSYGDTLRAKVDGHDVDMERLAQNDGFDSVEAFDAWFRPLVLASEGQFINATIIHWTELEY